MSYAAPTPPKFCKSLLATGSATLTPTMAARFFDKALYEFWGFVINGGPSLTIPGGFAPNGINEPAAFQSGSGVLLATGGDGSTTFGTTTFKSPSVNFMTLIPSGTLIGKYLVTWVPGSDSTDDGVYQILGVADANHIAVDIHSGGTRRLGNHPFFWDRTDINFRIVDIVASCYLTGWNSLSASAYMVLQLTGAPEVNLGQATSQFMVMHTTSAGTSEGNVGLQFSPAGTWNGSSFSDGTNVVTSSWFNGNAAANGLCTYAFIGSPDFLIAEARSFPPGAQGSFTAGSGFHVEIPQRLYSEEADPNPLAWVRWSNATPSQVAATYYNGFRMVGLDSAVHAWTTLVKSPMGTNVRPDYTGNAYGTGQWQQFGLPAFRFVFESYDQPADAYVTTDGVLSLSTPGQFSLARARLRRVRFTSADLPYRARIGDPILDPNGWVHISNGVLWPWDDSIMPEGPWRFGV